MSLTLPEHLHEKIGSFPESSYGATRVTLVLADGRRIESVYVAWQSDIAKIGARMISSADELGFHVSDVVDVLNETMTDKRPEARKSHAGTGIAVGIAVGAALGATFDQLAIGIALGTAFGAALDVASHVRHKNQQKTP